MDSSLGIAFSVFAIVSPLLEVAVCPVPGTFGRAVSTWFASIGRRSARCLAPVGRAVPGTCWGEAVQPGLPALDGWYIRCPAPVGRPLPSGPSNASTVWRQVATAKP